MDPRDLARRIRIDALRMVHGANASHIGSSLSAADLLAVLYGCVLRVDPAGPRREDRDRFILSKGHAAAGLYAALAECGFFPPPELERYCQDGSALLGHVSHAVPGVEVSTGSLGHGLPIGCGMALAARRDGRPWRVFVLLSDGELDEGSNWESALFAPQHGLDNLTVIVDHNRMQGFGATCDVLDLGSVAAKWAGFRWAVEEVDGHDLTAIAAALGRVPFRAGSPSALIAHTVKGKGVSFMENSLAWHYKSPDAGQLAAAIREVEEGA